MNVFKYPAALPLISTRKPLGYPNHVYYNYVTGIAKRIGEQRGVWCSFKNETTKRKYLTKSAPGSYSLIDR